MFFLSIRLSKRKLLSAAAAVIVLVLVCFSFYKSISSTNPNADTFEKRSAFLSDFGFDITGCKETVTELLLPDKEDAVLIRYNKLQSICGFDLLPYCNKPVKRYSYVIEDNKKIISLIVADGCVIGGDILDAECYEYMPLCGGEINGSDTDR